MPKIIEYKQPTKRDYIIHEVADNTLLSEWLAVNLPSSNVALLLGDDELKNSAVRLYGDDIVSVWPKLGATGLAVATWVALAISVVTAVYAYQNMPDNKVGDSAQASSVYNYNGQGNSVRKGNPVPVQYGRMPYYPDLVCPQWHEYVDNEQVVYQTFSRGVGKFFNHGYYIGETPLSNYAGDIEVNAYNPGESVNSHHQLVWTSPEVGGSDGQGGLELVESGHPDGTGLRFDESSPFYWRPWEGQNAPNYIDRRNDSDNKQVLFPWAVGDIIVLTNTTGDHVVHSDASLSFTSNTITCSAGWGSLQVGNFIIIKSGGNGANDGMFQIDSLSGNDITVLDDYGNAFGAFSLMAVSCTVYHAQDHDGYYLVGSLGTSGYHGGLIQVHSVDHARIGIPNFNTGNNWLSNTVTLYTAYSPVTSSDWIGDFVAKPQSWSGGAQDVGFDVILPQGLYHSNSDGGLNNRTVEMEVRFREKSEEFYQLKTITFTRNDRTPYRETFWLSELASGLDFSKEYVLGFKRVTIAQQSVRVVDTIQISSLKSKLQATQSNPEETYITLKITATNSLGSAASKKFWCDDTRLLNVLQNDGETFIEQTSNSVIDATIDACLNPVYGAGLSAADIDIDTLLAYRPVLAARGDECNGIFDTGVAFWDALSEILKAGRCYPRLETDNTLSLWRDEPRDVIGEPYSPINTLPNSFSASVKSLEDDAYDGVEIEWFNPVTRQAEKTLGALPHQSGLKPKPLKYKFITNGAQALREALFQAAVEAYRVCDIKLTTDIAGFEANYGDIVPIAHDAIGWGAFGEVLEIDNSGPDTLLRLSGYHPSADNNSFITFNKGGYGNHGPYRIEPTDDAEIYKLIDSVPQGFDVVELGVNGKKHSHYIGMGETQHKNAIVMQVSPASEYTVSITLQEDDARVWVYA